MQYRNDTDQVLSVAIDPPIDVPPGLTVEIGDEWGHVAGLTPVPQGLVESDEFPGGNEGAEGGGGASDGDGPVTGDQVDLGDRVDELDPAADVDQVDRVRVLPAMPPTTDEPTGDGPVGGDTESEDDR